VTTLTVGTGEDISGVAGVTDRDRDRMETMDNGDMDGVATAFSTKQGSDTTTRVLWILQHLDKLGHY